MIGVIGGMGPLATADFVQKVIAATPAEHDEDHVPLLISNDPRIPRRPAAILKHAESPLLRLIEIRDRLTNAGASALVMPCNTAHYWHQELAAGCGLPFPSIIEATCDVAVSKTANQDRVGIVATKATLASGLFQAALEQRQRDTMLPTEQVSEQLMLPAIAHVKAGRLDKAGPLMTATVEHLLERGAKTVILACTEAPIAMANSPDALARSCIDSTEALALATVKLWRELQAR